MPTLKQQIEANFTANRSALTEETNTFYNNIVYFLFKHSLVKLKNIDVASIFDNLYINNEVITADNIDDYDIKRLADQHFTTEEKIKNKILNKNKVLLLNYYYNNYDYKDCFIFLDDIDDRKLWME